MSSIQPIRSGLSDRLKTVIWIFSCMNKCFQGENKKKNKQKMFLVTFYLPSALSSLRIIIAFLLDEKIPALKSHFYGFEKKKKTAFFFFSQLFLFLSFFTVLGKFHGLLVDIMGILNSGKAIEAWKADYWVHLQRRKLKKIHCNICRLKAWKHQPFVSNLVRLFPTEFCVFNSYLD